jgi:hypothetical protein
VRPDVLSARALNRATLARQHLLSRVDATVTDEVHHLVGLQAQVPLNPYLGLWSRLDGFEPRTLADRLLDRSLVRIVLMRGTIHLVTADDCLGLRKLFQPVLDTELDRHVEHGPVLRGLDLRPVLGFAKRALAERPLNGNEFRAALAARFPDHDAAALAYACRNRLALVQVPPRGLWDRGGQVRTTTAEAWLGRPLIARPSIGDVLLRYLAAFGPATAADASTWTRLPRLREPFERLRPRLRVFADERGRELFDVPDAPRPDPDTPAPPRFLPEYDNVLLSHSDRSRFTGDARAAATAPASGSWHGAWTLDGVVAGTWMATRDRSSGASTVTVQPAQLLRAKDRRAVEAEARRLSAFVHADAGTRKVRFAAVP